MEKENIKSLRLFLSKDSNVSLIAGGLAGVISRTLVSPIERVKILLQLQHGVDQKNGIHNIIKDMYKKEGVHGLFRGNGINCIRVFPYSATQFMVFEYLKKNLFHVNKLDKNQQLKNWQRLFCASVGAFCSLLITQPMDLVRIRLSIHTEIGTSPGLFSLFYTIFRDEGGVYGLYRGMIPASLQVLPCVAINFAMYEQLKEFEPEKERENIWQDNVFKFSMGCISGAIAQTISYPFDLLRKRFQVINMNKNSKNKIDMATKYQYKNVIDGLVTIGKTDGLKGYYKGLSASLVKFIPATAISWVAYESISDLMKVETSIGPI